MGSAWAQHGLSIELRVISLGHAQQHENMKTQKCLIELGKVSTEKLVASN